MERPTPDERPRSLAACVHRPCRAGGQRDALAHFDRMPHHEPVGDLRIDLIGELVSFRTAMTERRLDRALAVLAERAGPVPELAEVRAVFVEDGERPMRQLLGPVVDAPALEAVTAMLFGAIVHPVLLRGAAPSDQEIATVVDVVLSGLRGMRLGRHP